MLESLHRILGFSDEFARPKVEAPQKRSEFKPESSRLWGMDFGDIDKPFSRTDFSRPAEMPRAQMPPRFGGNIDLPAEDGGVYTETPFRRFDKGVFGYYSDFDPKHIFKT